MPFSTIDFGAGRDDRLEAAKIRHTKNEPPVIGIKDNREAETRAYPVLVQPRTAFQDLRSLRWSNPFSVILDRDRRTGWIGGCRAGLRNALSSRLPKTSARSVRSSGVVAPSGIRGSNVSHMPTGVRAKIATNERTSGASSVDAPTPRRTHVGSLPRRAPQCRARSPARPFRAAGPRPTPAHNQRRFDFECMGEVGSAATRALNLLL